jgi:hypothetical protein
MITIISITAFVYVYDVFDVKFKQKELRQFYDKKHKQKAKNR